MKRAKHFISSRALLVLCAMLGTIQCMAQAPEWVTQRPVSDKEYIGIGIAKLSDNDYMKIAAQNALSDIASQVATKVENESFLNTVDVDGKSTVRGQDYKQDGCLDRGCRA